MIFLALLLFSLNAFAGDILMIDLNNQGDEVSACLKAAKKDPGTQVHFVGQSEPVTVQSIEDKIRFEESEGRKIDTIIVSGHDGSGLYFGSLGNISSEDITGIVDRDPTLKDSLNSMALWGCYTGNANAAANFWMKNISPNIKATVAFSLQSPIGTDPANAAILADYCGGRRKQIVEAASEAEMTDALRSIPNPKNLSLSICYPDGICSDTYGDKKAPSCYHTYDELYDRCREFDPGGEGLKTFQDYFEARSEKFANPPPDTETYYETKGSAGHYEKGVLRQYYDSDQLWYHCFEQLQHETGYIMPPPMSVIRLVKFNQLKANFAVREKPIIDQYNEILQRIGMGKQAFDFSDPKESRKRIIEKIMAVTQKLEPLDNDDNTSTVNGLNVHAILKMTYGFNNSLNVLEPSCTPFNWVDPEPKGYSQCMAAYGKDPAWP